MLGQMDYNLESLNEKIDALVAKSKEEQHRLAKERMEIINWMSPLNFHPVQNEVFRKRTPNTGTDLLTSATFEDWIATRGQTLWCHGIRMTSQPYEISHQETKLTVEQLERGKRSLRQFPFLTHGCLEADLIRATVVDHLRVLFHKRRDVAVAVAYCNYKEQYRQTPVNLLAAIWRQLIPPTGVLSSNENLTYRTHQGRGTSLELREISDLLLEGITHFSKVFIVVDALDECSDKYGSRSTVLRELRRLFPKLSLMVTSRPLDDLRSQFSNGPHLNIEASDSDMKKYIQHRIREEGRLSRHVARDPGLEATIIREVLSRAKHM
jgi:hypothetical protein